MGVNGFYLRSSGSILSLCLALATMGATACGGSDGGNEQGELAPGDVRFADLQGGFWVTEDTAAGASTQVLQFLTASQARALYGDRGVIGVGTAVLGTAMLDDMLAAFGDDDPMALVFPRGGGQVRTVYAVRVRDGNLGLSALGESARNVEDGVLFEFGFTEPVDVRMTRFVRNERLEFGVGDEPGPLGGAFTWRDDCRWNGRAGWVFTVTANYEIDPTPWTVSALTGSGDFINYFHHDTGYLGSQVWSNGACPVSSIRSLPLRTGNTLVPWGQDDVAVLYHGPDGLRGGVVDDALAADLATLDETVDGRIQTWRAVDDTTLVVLEQHERGPDSLFLPMRRTVLSNLTQRSDRPLPPIPADARDVNLRLLPDGRATWSGTVQAAPGEPRQLVAGIELTDGVWTPVELVDETDDGVVVDLRAEDAGATVWVDAEQRVTAIASARAVIPPLHRGRPLSERSDALVRIHQGRAEVHVLTASVQGQFARRDGLRDGRGDLDSRGTFVWLSQLDEVEDDDDRLVVTRWPVDGVPHVQAVAFGVAARALESEFFQNAIYKGTPIPSQPELVLGDDGSVIAGDGWARTYVRPADGAAVSERYDVTIALDDAPPGARLYSSREPVFDCTEECTMTVDRGTVVDVRVDVPDGWVAVAPTEARCTDLELDAGYCVLVADADAEHRFAFRRTLVEAVADTVGDWYMIDAVAGSDGVIAAHIATAGRQLADGTEVTGASPQSPVEALARWSGTSFSWLRRLEGDLSLRTWSFAGNGDVVALLVADRGATSYVDPDLGELTPRADDRVVLRLDASNGTTREARIAPLPDRFAAYGEGLDAMGRLIVVGESLGEITDDERTGLSISAGQRAIIRYEPDGTARLVASEPIGRPGTGQTRVMPLGTDRALVLRDTADGGLRRQVIGDDGAVARDDVLALSVDGASVATVDLAVSPGGDELLIAFLATGDAQVEDDVLSGSAPSVVVFALDPAGEVGDPVRLDLPEASFDDRPRAITRLADGSYMAAANRQYFGQESFIVEDVGAITTGPVVGRGGDLSGYVTGALSALDDGRVVWMARHWGGQVIRPYTMPGSFTAVLAPDRLLTTQDMLVRE